MSYPNNPPPAAPQATVTVPIKSATNSKINWFNVITALFSLSAAVGFGIPADWKDTILTLSGVLSPVVTIIMRTFFTKSVLRPSM